MAREVRARRESWPIAGRFTIARGSRVEAEVVVVEIEERGAIGRGECVPYPRYGETIDGVIASIEAGAPIGSARSAIDAAELELDAKLAGATVARRLGLPEAAPFASAITISIDAPEVMARAARELRDRPLLKLKLAGDGLDLERVRAVRAEAPLAPLWVDANEGWDVATYDALAPRLAELGVALLEQPLAAGDDGALRGRARPVPVCADESAHGADTVAPLADRYDAINVKLDKAGGLRGAIRAIDAARGAGLRVALGCMVSTSLSIAPACLLVPRADWIDLDGSLLLARDREGGAHLDERGWVVPPGPRVWGG
jgi:L-alanine-DL-glutamate epimerase-like enolase superfamily enzyme